MWAEPAGETLLPSSNEVHSQEVVGFVSDVVAFAVVMLTHE